MNLSYPQPWLDPYRHEPPSVCELCRLEFCLWDCNPLTVDLCPHRYPDGRGCEECAEYERTRVH